MHEGNSGGPASVPAGPLTNTLFCLYCCQQAKRIMLKDPDKAKNMQVNPAITMTFVIISGFPINVLVCGDHLEVNESNLVTG